MRQNYFAGQWSGAASGRTRERRNPADTDEVVAVAVDSDATDVREAVAAVVEGSREWAERSPEARAEVLGRTADILAARSDELARDLVREEGKTLAEALNETRRTPLNLRFYASDALRLVGQTFATGDGSLVLTTRQPVGVVAAITPWNFPLNIPSRKLAPALAAGNGVVFKPSELTPATAEAFVRALLEAGLPPGAIALVHGGAEAGSALVADERVAAITFTGSSSVGAAIHRASSPRQRCQLEMGGKNPMVVMADADLDRAAALIARGAFGLSGQACTGTSRVIVEDRVHDELVDRLVTAARGRIIGNGLVDGVDMGPLATETQLSKVQAYVSAASDNGAKLCTGDEALPAGCEHGHFTRPAVLTGVEPDSALAQQEVFGPVLAVLRAGSYDEAIAIANGTEYGLSAGIVTRDLGRAMDFARRMDSGIVKVNLPTTGVAMNAPFGGVKNSSTQTFKEQAGDTMMHFYTVDKTVYLSS
ncbi:MAG: aldehyde dehydrogenase family protein [Jatrophihabitantaceae bacterium]